MNPKIKNLYELIRKTNLFILVIVFIAFSFYVFLINPKINSGLNDLYYFIICIYFFIYLVIYCLFYLLEKTKNNTINKIFTLINVIINILTSILIVCELIIFILSLAQYSKIDQDKQNYHQENIVTNNQAQPEASLPKYEFKKNNADYSLIEVRNDGTNNIIVLSMKSLTKWTDMYYPKEVSFPPYSDNIFFVKYLSETGHSAGFYMLNIKTLELKELKTIGEIYEDYYNYISIKSPDGFKIASLGYNKLYLLDLENDKATVLAQAEAGEVFYPAGNVPDFIWLDNNTIQYPIHYQKDIENGTLKVIEIKQVKIELNLTNLNF